MSKQTLKPISWRVKESFFSSYFFSLVHLLPLKVVWLLCKLHGRLFHDAFHVRTNPKKKLLQSIRVWKENESYVRTEMKNGISKKNCGILETFHWSTFFHSVSLEERYRYPPLYRTFMYIHNSFCSNYYSPAFLTTS